MLAELKRHLALAFWGRVLRVTDRALELAIEEAWPNLDEMEQHHMYMALLKKAEADLVSTGQLPPKGT